MKDKLIYIISAVAVLLLGLSIYLIIDKFTAPSIHKIVCTFEQDGKFKSTYQEKIFYDNTGKLVKTESLIKNVYETQKEFELAKEAIDDEVYEYKFYPKNNEIDQLKTIKEIKNEDGEEAELWYITYINILESQGYTCK